MGGFTRLHRQILLNNKTKRKEKKRKSYVKNHISIDLDTRLIHHFCSSKRSKFDTRFATTSIRNIKKYKQIQWKLRFLQSQTKKFEKDSKIDINSNLIKFNEQLYSYAKISSNPYSSKY